jgi:succinate dehydrogenase/fumarate reductase cytochrome b subunit
MNEPNAVTASRPDSRWQRIQALSGVTFSTFLLLHLVNQALATLGSARYDSVQGVLTKGYQFLPVELVVVTGSLLVHMTAAVRGMWRRRGASPPAHLSWRVRLHRYSGRFLLVVVLGHFAATRGTGLLFGTPPHFAGVAWTFQWTPLYFWPYYTLLGWCGWYHLVHGLSTSGALLNLKWLSWLSRPTTFKVTVGAGLVAITLGVLSFGGVFFDVGTPWESPYAKTVLRLVGR